MFKTVTLVSLLLFGIISASVFAETQEAESEEEYVVVPVNISLVPAISTQGRKRIKTINYFKVNVIAGYSDKVQGVALGVVDITGEDVVGLEANVVNVVGGNLSGVQPGVVNVTIGDSKGVQLGVTNFIGTDQSGLQAGVVNYATKVKGLQLGVVNVAKEADGVPIGLVSIVLKGGQTHGQTWIDEQGIVNFAFIHGSKTVYNIYTAGIDVTGEFWTAGLGLGVHIPIGSVFLNIEGIVSGLASVDASDVKGFWNRERFYIGYSPLKRLSIIGGLSFNYFRSEEGEDFTLSSYGFDFGDGTNQIWPGFFIGIQF